MSRDHSIYKQSAVPPHRDTYNLLTMNRSVIIEALKSTVQTWFQEDPNRVTVRAARSHVEQELGLGQGFLENEDWKAEAKRVVKDEFAALNEELDKRANESKKPAIAKKPTAGTSKKQTMRSRKPTATGEGDAGKAPKTKRGRPSSKKITEEATGSEKAPATRDSPAAVTAKKLAPKRTRAKPTVQDEEEELEVDTPPAYSLPLPLAVITPDGDNELLDIPNKKSPEELKVLSQPSAKATPTKDKDGSESELSDVSEEPPKRKGKRALIARPDSPKKKAKPSPKPAEIIEGPGKDFKTILQDRSMPSLDADVDDAGAGSDSEMSIVLDPTPQKGRSSITKVPPPKKTKASKAPAKKGKAKKSDPSTKLDPEQEQLKSLKAWLLKCGIRRIWTRELAKFETPREQIAHLKGILTDIGMTGRYSADKAKKIKAKRELKAELEAIQVNAGSWGMEEKNTAEDVGRSRRRSGGRKARIVIDDEDEEEVDAGGNIVRAREKEMEDLAFMDGHSESE